MATSPTPGGTPVSIDLHKIGEHRFQATNARGGSVTIGHGDDPDFTPVELLLAAIEACGALDIDFITGKRAPFADFLARAQGLKVRDEQGNHVVDIQVTYDARFPEGEAGDAARAVLPDAVRKSQERLCTVGRTVTLGSPVAYAPGELER